MIDNLYKEVDKNHYYLGMISKVTKNYCNVQIENLSWLTYRKLKKELLIPNTINFYVVIDSITGIYIGEVFKSEISSFENIHDSFTRDEIEKVLPDLSIEIVGILKPDLNKFKLPGFNTVGVTDQVYIANDQVINLFLNSFEVKENNNEENLSNFARLSNAMDKELFLKPSTLFDRHLMAVGTTNSGKSTSSLTILDKLIKDDKKILIIDPTGEYKDSFSPETQIKKLNLGDDTTLNTESVSFTQWATLFETNDSSQPAVLSEAITSLRYQYAKSLKGVYKKDTKSLTDVENDLSSISDDDKSFQLDLLDKQVIEEAVEADKNGNYTKATFQFNNKQWLVQKIRYKFSSTQILNFFKNDSTLQDLLAEIDNFMKNKTHSLYINTSTIGVGDGIGSMIIDLISNHIINKKEKDHISFVYFIDEVHRYTKDSGTKDYQSALTSIAREGRKKGVFLFLTTQNPQDVPPELLGQIGTLLVHRLTHRNEKESMRNYLSDYSYGHISRLNQGEAILTSINLIKDLHVSIIKCNRTHHNTTTLL